LTFQKNDSIMQRKARQKEGLMPLFGDSDGPKLKLTRPVIIMMAVLGGLLVIVIVLAILLSSNVFGAKTANTVPAPTATIKVAEVEATEAVPSVVPSAVPPTAPPAAVTRVPTSAPPPTSGTDVVSPAATEAPIPAPTVGEPGGQTVQQATPGGEGGGEISELPGGSSGLPWLIPLGAVLLAAVAWWRWRRARSEG
jgi:hypothetical protein